jgi:hypothetical protein
MAVTTIGKRWMIRCAAGRGAGPQNKKGVTITRNALLCCC